MRKIINLQQNLFSPSMFDFEINLESRDEIPKLLIGLQYILKTPDLRDEVFKVLKENRIRFVLEVQRYRLHKIY